MTKIISDGKKTANDIDIPKIDIDKGINSLLAITPFIKMSELITYFKENAKVSRITVIRSINRLKNQKDIIKIHSDNFLRYGIKETDSRQIYIASKEIQKIKEHLDKIFEMLESKDADEIRIGVRELRHAQSIYFNKYVLDSDQLDTLRKVIDKTISEPKLNSDETRNIILMIMLNAISSNNNKIRPSDEKAFLETLRTLSDMYPTKEFHAKPHNPISYLTQLLGIYRDKKIIERLEKDAVTCNPQLFQQIAIYYQNKLLAKVIDDDNLNLMKYEAKLQKDGMVEALDFIESIRRYASNELKMLRTTSERWLYEDW